MTRGRHKSIRSSWICSRILVMWLVYWTRRFKRSGSRATIEIYCTCRLNKFSHAWPYFIMPPFSKRALPTKAVKVLFANEVKRRHWPGRPLQRSEYCCMPQDPQLIQLRFLLHRVSMLHLQIAVTSSAS